MVKMTVTALKSDFSGYATKANLKCTDGRTIKPEAFQHMDGVTVPLMWMHGHKDINNVLGHAVLEARSDGVYAQGFFNDTPNGKIAKAIVHSGNVKALSIWANQLVEKAKQVLHGEIREVSLVLAGANKGAFIENVAISHGDEIEELDDEVIISAGESLEHGILNIDDLKEGAEGEDEDEDNLEHATVQEVYDSMSDDQKDCVHLMLAAALESGSAAHSDDSDDENDEGDLDKEGLKHMNLFDKTGGAGDTVVKHELSHDAMQGILADMQKPGQTLKSAVEAYGVQHGITDIDTLFPEAKNLTSTPEFLKRRTEWVAGVLSACGKTPFSRIKTVAADITMESARALGYITGNYKKEEWFAVSARTTGPTTIYKKQKLDRDDIIDITDFDVVAWMKGEMRLMIEEEIARAILISDGRPVEDPANPGEPNPDKIADPAAANSGNGVRSIINEHELFKTDVTVNIGDAGSKPTEVVDEILRNRKYYRGTGTPTLYTTEANLTYMLLARDTLDRKLWPTAADLAAEMRVSNIVTVEVMETNTDLFGIIVNLADYNIGADKGGELSLFDQFDIDYNQQKYLIETRISGALTKIKSALVIWTTAAANVLVPDEDLPEPTFVESTGVATLPAKTGVVWKNALTNATLTAGAQTAIAAGATISYRIVPASGYYFETNEFDGPWTFTRDA
jgi:phage head maturation protease